MRVPLGFVSLLLVAGVNAEGAINNGKRPNIVLVLTDDQDIELGSMNFMPRTLKRIRDEGVEMRHAYATTTVCCPSRSSLLTGRYVHNHGVYSNDANCTSVYWQREHEPHSFGAYLSRAGYRTGYFGKYLNQYDGSYVPPGWSDWTALVRFSVFYNYSANTNGRKMYHGNDYNTDYATDLIANRSIAFLQQSKDQFDHQPFLLVTCFTAPHFPEDAAPQYQHLFYNVTSHHTPAYDYAPNKDKQWILQMTPKMSPMQKEFTDILMTKRLQSLQSVDVAVDRIYQVLDELGELNNTYIVYTSDHGYHIGQYGLIKGKGFPFEFDIRVPFFVRGPDIKPGSVMDEIVLNIDLGPTFLDIAGLEIPARMDGSSFKKLLPTSENDGRSKATWRDTFLIESPRMGMDRLVHLDETTAVSNDQHNVTIEKYPSQDQTTGKSKIEEECMKSVMICSVHDEGYWKTPPLWRSKPFCACINANNNLYTCIRTINSSSNFLYCRFEDGTKIFNDLENDPFQLSNRHTNLTATEKSFLEDRVDKLQRCKGAKECTVGNEV